MNSDNDQKPIDDDGHVVGIDVGGTSIRAAISGITGSILAQARAATGVGGQGLIEQVRDIMAEVCDAPGINRTTVKLTALGVAGVPNAKQGTLSRAPNLIEVEQVQLVAELEATLGHPVILENDANIAALGELHHGAGAAHDNFVVISVGTGLGMGIIAGGSLIRGAKGGAGEIGFLPFGADPLDERSHLHGALEEMVSGEGLVRAFALATNEQISSEEVFSRAELGHQDAVQVLDELARWIGAAIASVYAILDPGIIVLNGSVGSRKLLIDPIRQWVGRHGVEDLPIQVSTLGEQAPLLGAIFLAREGLVPNLKALVT